MFRMRNSSREENDVFNRGAENQKCSTQGVQVIMGAHCIPNWEIPKIIGIDASTWCRRQKNGFLNLSVYELNRLNLSDKEVLQIVKGELYE